MSFFSLFRHGVAKRLLISEALSIGWSPKMLIDYNSVTSLFFCKYAKKLHSGPNSDVSMTSLEQNILRAKTEYEFLKLDGCHELPSEVSDIDWKVLAELSSAARKKHFKFLFINECKRKNGERERTERREYINSQRLKKAEAVELYEQGKGHIVYGLWNNCLMLKVEDRRMENYQNYRIANALMYGSQIVFDMSFFDVMSARELSDLSKQISYTGVINRVSNDPFYINFCNCAGMSQEQINTYFPSFAKPKSLIRFHRENYLDIFPREKLIYLTPDSPHDMLSFDHDAIYIIGALVDKGTSKPLTYARAKKETMRTCRLPLERYLDWGHGKKSLPLNIIFGILLDLKNSGNWTQSLLKHIPPRFLKEGRNSTKHLARRTVLKRQFK